MTITTQDALSILKNNNYVIAPEVFGLPSVSSRELQTCLISALEDYKRVKKDAERYQFLRSVNRILISDEASRNPVAYDAAIDQAIDAQIAKEKS